MSGRAARLRRAAATPRPPRRGPQPPMGPARQAALPCGAAWPHGEPGGRVHRGTPSPARPCPGARLRVAPPPGARGSTHRLSSRPTVLRAASHWAGARHLCGRGLRDSRAPGGLFSRGRQGTGRAPTARPPCSQEADRLPAGSGAQTARPGPLPARPSPTHEAKAAALHAPCSSSFTPNAARTAQLGAGTAHTHHSTRPARGWGQPGRCPGGGGCRWTGGACRPWARGDGTLSAGPAG